ncbi:MAG: AMP-binding protein [Lachnospiraceae bacterium]|nr:AMP-binding protein [Lachnospiraceae bacterium]
MELALDSKIQEIAGRIKVLRELENKTPEEMAYEIEVPLEEYLNCEAGKQDLNFTFIYRCAQSLKVSVTDILEGYSPNLRSYTMTRAGGGQKISRAHGMTYYNLAYAFQNRIAEPLYVRSIFDPEAQDKPIDLTKHDGQECDIVVEGSLKVQIGEHSEILGPGDSIYYDSGTPHGMIAVGGQDCIFYAIVLNPAGEPIPELTQEPMLEETSPAAKTDDSERIWHEFIEVEENDRGTPTKISFKKSISRFNFAFDLVDAVARREPEKLAMLHISKDGTEKRITFEDMRKESARCANYFKALGIKKGDRVMLILKRHYQFWYAIVGLHKIGAIAIPATNQLLEHDLEYRFRAAGVTSIICTPDGDTAHQVELAQEKYGGLQNMMIVNGSRPGWRSFDEEYQMYSSRFRRTGTSPCGDDLMLMYFTSGTSGYPKIATHSYKLPLGHFHTAKYWQTVDPDGLHFTISDTGWAKAAWGKIYGQWMCEGAIFVYDFDRFDASKILPMFAKYHITTFCAPPTMLRLMIKQDISQYDFSSVKHMTTAGEALNPEVYRQFEKATGLRIMEGFGQTETAVIIANMVGAPHKIGSMGRPVPTYHVELLGEDGKPVKSGEEGEICIDISQGLPCGVAVMYYRNEEETKATWKDGWYHTGDLAWRDEDGFYWYVGRKDDVIKSSGYRIGPFEIESVLMELPYVLECGVSPAKDPVRGFVVKASIVLVPGVEGTDALVKEIQEYVKKHTAPYKYPRIVEFKDELPKTTSGKIIRHML